MSFDAALHFVLRSDIEGDFTDNPKDKGGPTNHGVTQKVYDRFRMTSGLPSVSVKLITDAEVAKIYLMQYWRPAMCDKFSNCLSLVVFDSAVNHGVSKAIRLLQRAAGVKEDGKCGPVTLSKIANFDDKTIVSKYLKVRESFYSSIVELNPEQEVFLDGWMNRLTLLRKELKCLS